MTAKADIIFRYEGQPKVYFNNRTVKVENGKVIVHTQTIKPMYEHYQNCLDLVAKYNGEIYGFCYAEEYNMTDVKLYFTR